MLPRDATQPGNIAMCSELMDFHSADVRISDQSSEDCLLLNVFTKEVCDQILSMNSTICDTM